LSGFIDDKIYPFGILRLALANHFFLFFDKLIDTTDNPFYNITYGFAVANVSEVGLNKMVKIKGLTLRQKAFLAKFLDVYREKQEPVHYSAVAQRLGVNNSTAYDMLRLLEKKGMVNSHYATPKTTAGPGRSSILFSPTLRATESRPTGDSRGHEKWEEFKTRLLEGLSRETVDEYQAALDELLTKIAELRSSLEQYAEFTTALLLNLQEARPELTG
jgi:DNA-binding MarR family transcriptional regulator